MNPTAIYSKSGKGVQEASGKTSLLNRGDRAVLAAIDGRATLQDVAQKVGKAFDNAFQDLIGKLDKDGFIREASPGVAPKTAAPAAKPAAGKPAAKKEDSGGFGDLDFSALGAGAPKAAPAPSRPVPPPQRPAPPPPPRPAAPPPPPPPPPKPNPAAEAQAKAQQSALQKAREEAEAKADAERQRIKLEAEAKMRAEMEAKARDETSQKLKLEAERKAKEEADAKIKAAQEAAARAAAEAKAKADAEAKARVEAERKAREEAERARKAAEEEARRAREEAEKARKAAEEEARKAREEAERARKAAEEEARKAREEAERVRKAAEEERKREEAERAARRKREEEEAAERRRAREEEDRRHEEERAAKRKQQEEADELEASASRAARKKKQEEEASAPAPTPAKSEAAGGLDSLLSDLDSFTTHEETERKEREEAERKAREAAAQRAREEEERRAREEAERTKKEEARARKEEEKRRKREEEEELARKREAEEKRLKQEEEKRKKEADERERKAKADEVLAARATRGPATAVGEDTDEVRKRMLGRRGAAAPAAFEPVRRSKSGLGKPIAIVLVLLLVVAVGAVHVMPVSTAEYERAASEALGRPVKIGEASLSLLGGGVQIKLKNIQVGDEIKIASGAASPDLGSLRSEKKNFSRIELEGVTLPQEALGQALLARVKGENFSVQRVVVKKLELSGAAILPKPLEADLVYGADGNLTQATVRGPDTLLAHISPKGNAIDFEVTASGFPLPVLPELTLSTFRMKGTAGQRGMQIAEWGGKLYGGSVSGTANLRWGGGWSIDGVVTARELNAAVFAPALLSQGKGEGTGRFSMSGADPSKLGSGGRLEGSFTINSGVLGSFDLGRVIRTSGKEFAGQTQFSELTGQATYERGAVSLRNVSIGAGALNAGASVDIAQSGALSGRIVADMKSSTGRAVNATLHLGGTIKEPQVRN